MIRMATNGERCWQRSTMSNRDGERIQLKSDLASSSGRRTRVDAAAPRPGREDFFVG